MIDHLECGAYKTFYPDINTKEEELAVHKKHMKLTKVKMFKLFPEFKFRGYLMDLDGKCT